MKTQISSLTSLCSGEKRQCHRKSLSNGLSLLRYSWEVLGSILVPAVSYSFVIFPQFLQESYGIYLKIGYDLALPRPF